MSGIQAPPGFRDMRLVLLQHGGLASLTGKTGLAMLRHRAGPIVAVIDPDHTGQSLQRVTGIERDVPVVADLAAALPYAPEVAVVGLAPSGGRLPDPVRHDALAALRAGLHLASGSTPGWPMILSWRKSAGLTVGSGIFAGSRKVSTLARPAPQHSLVGGFWRLAPIWLSAR